MSATVARGLAPVRTELPDGGVVIVQETSMIPAVTISATFRAGSQCEPEELPGLASLTAKLLDRGTERRPARVIAEELDDRGVSMKVSANRHTLLLTCTCLTDDFDDVLAMLIDMARRPVFPEEELAKRRAEQVTAIGQDEDNPAARAAQGLLHLLYGPLHPYGRPQKGTVASLDRIAREDLVAFHARCVRPSSLTLAIVGDVDADHALERARRELEGWNDVSATPGEIPAPAPLGGRREQTIDMPGKSQSDICYGFVAIRRMDPRFYAYWMMNNILGQFGLGGRLAENIRERQGMAYYAFSTFDPAHGEAPLIVRAGVDPRNVQRALAAIDHEVRSLKDDGPTDREMSESREYLVGSIPRMFETNQSIAHFLLTCEEYGLGLDYDRRLPALLRSVTTEEVRSAAAESLDPNRASVVIAGPAEAAA